MTTGRIWLDNEPTQVVPLAVQLQQLEQCAIMLNHGIHKRDLLKCVPRRTIERTPYLELLLVMGTETTDERNLPLSPNIWNCDRECVLGASAYVSVLERLAALAGEDLPLKDISCVTDDVGEFVLRFSLDSIAYVWMPQQTSDWLDTAMIDGLARLLRARKRGRRFVYLDLHMQNCLIGCFTKTQLQTLRSTTRLNFHWLNRLDSRK